MGCLVVFSTVVSCCTTNGVVTQYAINSTIAKSERNQSCLSKLVGRRGQGEGFLAFDAVAGCSLCFHRQ